MYAVDGDRRIFFDVVGQHTGWREGELVDRPVVVVVHGGPGIPHVYLRPWVSLLAQRFCVVYLDLSGAGWSSRAPGSGYPLEGLVDDVDLVRRTLGLDRIALLGHSFGGVVAMEYALAHPEALSALVLAATIRSLPVTRENAVANPPPAMAEDDIGTITEFMTAMFTAYATGDSAALDALDAHPGWGVVTRAQWMRKPALQEVVERNLRFGTEAYVATTGVASAMPDVAALGDWDVTPRLPGIAAPTLVLAADSPAEFVASPDVHGRQIAAGIPDARLEVFDDTGHNLFAEEPTRFAEVVTAFLEGAGLQGADDDATFLSSAT